MPSKVQFYSQMADHTATQITGSYQSWVFFLETAGRLYKYPYNEQLIIHAQRPEQENHHCNCIHRNKCTEPAD